MLAGKLAIVTGGGRGIGAEIARALAQRGASLGLIGRNPDSLSETAGSIGRDCSVSVVWSSADASNETMLKRAISEIEAESGSTSILINNAGIAPSSPFLKGDAKFWQEVLNIDLMSAVYASQAVLPGMIANGRGIIINISSIAGLTGKAYITAYCAAKHAMIGLTRALAMELAQKGITVNAICPGYANTDIVSNAISNITSKTGRSSEDALSYLVGQNPQGRLIEPSEIAQTALWLCGPGAVSVTGQSIVLAGGELMP